MAATRGAVGDIVAASDGRCCSIVASGGGVTAAADPDDRSLLNRETGEGGRMADEAAADEAVAVADLAKALLGRRAAALPP